MALRNAVSAAAQSQSSQNFTNPTELWVSARSGPARTARAAASAARGHAWSGGASPLIGLAVYASARPDHSRAYPRSSSVARAQDSTARRVVRGESWFHE